MSIKPITLLIMAAGMGSRYGGLKQIDPIGPNNEIVIDYSIFDAIKAGFNKVVFVLRRDTEKIFRDKIGKTIEAHIDTHYVFQELDSIPDEYKIPEKRIKPWGTGHAVLTGINTVSEPFGVINADDFYGASSFEMLSDYLKHAEDKAGIYDFSLVGYTLKNTLSEHGHVARGVCKVNNHGLLDDVEEFFKIQRFENTVKHQDAHGTWLDILPETIVSMNMWGFTPSLFIELDKSFKVFLKNNIEDSKKEFLLPEVIDNLIKLKKAEVRVLKSKEKWYGVTYREDKPVIQQAVSAMISHGVYPAKLWK